MRKAELDAILERDTGPIEPHLRALAEERALPEVALVLCTGRIEEAAPALMAALEKAVRGEALGDSESRFLFRGLHILGAERRSEAFAPLMALLRRPRDEVETLLGDAITETLPGIVAGAFDGDSAALFAAIEDIAIDEFLRSSLLSAATFLAWDGRINCVEMARLLERFHAQEMAPPEDYAWVAWVDAIALLGERAFVEHVRSVFQRGLISERVMALSDFERAFAETERAPADPGRFERANRGYIEDVLVALGRFHHEPDDDFDDVWESNGSSINPWRDAGRNDPCPCGSGKKFKKCCLG